MDANQDGVVSLEEFLGACLGQSELCQLLALKAIEIFAEWDEATLEKYKLIQDFSYFKCCGTLIKFWNRIMFLSFWH